MRLILGRFGVEFRMPCTMYPAGGYLSAKKDGNLVIRGALLRIKDAAEGKYRGLRIGRGFKDGSVL